MEPVRYRKTVIHISKNARNAISKMRDNDTKLALSAIEKRVVTTETKPKNLLQRFLNCFRTESTLNVNIGKEKHGDFFVSTDRKVNNFRFVGKKVTLDLSAVKKDIGEFDSALLKSKDGILENLKVFNNAKKLFNPYKA